MLTNFPNGISAFPVIGAGSFDVFAGANENVYFVDGDFGSDGNDGKSPDSAMATIQAAVTAAAARNATYKMGSVIYIKALKMAAGATDPASYEENIVIPADGGDRMTLVGVSAGKTQGGLPQLKDGATTTQHILVIRAPGCAVVNLGFNGAGNTGGGILLDDDASTKSAFGTSILNCHFKNCKGSTATNAATGGAICWSAAGGAWQVLIKGNKFYKCVGDVVLLGTTSSRPQDVTIEDNIFSGPAGSVDCNLYLKGGSGMDGVVINNNVFPAWPAIGSGTNVMPISATGCVGVMTNNTFGCTGKTFGAAGNSLIPTTLLMANNYQEDGGDTIDRT